MLRQGRKKKYPSLQNPHQLELATRVVCRDCGGHLPYPAMDFLFSEENALDPAGSTRQALRQPVFHHQILHVLLIEHLDVHVGINGAQQPEFPVLLVTLACFMVVSSISMLELTTMKQAK